MGTLRRRGAEPGGRVFAAPFLEAVLAGVLEAFGLRAGVVFAAVFLGLELGLGMDFCLLVRVQSLDTRKNRNLNQFTYYPHFTAIKNN